MSIVFVMLWLFSIIVLLNMAIYFFIDYYEWNKSFYGYSFNKEKRYILINSINFKIKYNTVSLLFSEKILYYLFLYNSFINQMLEFNFSFKPEFVVREKINQTSFLNIKINSKNYCLVLNKNINFQENDNIIIYNAENKEHLISFFLF